MKKETYYCGVRGKQYGIWNKVSSRFILGIREDTPALADCRLYQIMGMDAKRLLKEGCEARMLPEG